MSTGKNDCGGAFILLVTPKEEMYGFEIITIFSLEWCIKLSDMIIPLNQLIV